MQIFIRFFLIFVTTSTFSQLLYYQDTYRGGVCVFGSSTADESSIIPIELQSYIEPGSIIKKVFLVYYRQSHRMNIPAPFDTLLLNEIPYHFGNPVFKTIKVLNRWMENPGYQQPYDGHEVFVEEISQSFNEGLTNNTLFWKTYPYEDLLSARHGAPQIVILYENLNLETITFSLVLFDQRNWVSMEMDFTDLPFNPINYQKDFVMSFQGDRLGPITHGLRFNLNNINAGLLYSKDIPGLSSLYGRVGRFYYQNGVATGLNASLVATEFNGNQTVLRCNSYLYPFPQPPLREFKIDYIAQNNIVPNNYPISFPIVYSTNCEPFEVTVSQDTSICPNIPLQLSATGGTRYEWQPATGLSCTDCPNPIATLDSSQLYTVRIWNNDSCSVVRPVKVNVRELPRFQSINPTASVCGLATGSVVAVAQNSTALPVSYSLNGGAFQPSSTFTGQFSNLVAGEYTLSLQDGFGCQRDTVFSIASTNETQALFTASPQSGAAPLTVSFTNTSTNATNYEWFVSTSSTTTGSTTTSQGTSLSTLTFDTSGVYTVTLVAWQNSPACADTFSLQISVFDTLILQIPNVFTPNNDGVNDFYSITSNLALNYECIILNRWGNVVTSKKSTFTPGVPELIWDGKDATYGTYFYLLDVEVGNERKKFEGFLVRVGE